MRPRGGVAALLAVGILGCAFDDDAVPPECNFVRSDVPGVRLPEGGIGWTLYDLAISYPTLVLVDGVNDVRAGLMVLYSTVGNPVPVGTHDLADLGGAEFTVDEWTKEPLWTVLARTRDVTGTLTVERLPPFVPDPGWMRVEFTAVLEDGTVVVGCIEGDQQDG